MYGLIGGYIYLEQPMTSAAWYCLGEYRCWVTFWRQELVPKSSPLFPKKNIPCQE